MERLKRGRFFEGSDDSPTTQQQKREAEELGFRLDRKDPIKGRPDEYYYSYVMPKN